jgi:hypothetical protein
LGGLPPALGTAPTPRRRRRRVTSMLASPPPEPPFGRLSICVAHGSLRSCGLGGYWAGGLDPRRVVKQPTPAIQRASFRSGALLAAPHGRTSLPRQTAASSATFASAYRWGRARLRVRPSRSPEQPSSVARGSASGRSRKAPEESVSTAVLFLVSEDASQTHREVRRALNADRRRHSVESGGVLALFCGAAIPADTPQC